MPPRHVITKPPSLPYISSLNSDHFPLRPSPTITRCRFTPTFPSMLPHLFLLFLFFLLCSVDVTTSFPAHADLSNCTLNFDCGPLRNLTYPFTGGTRPSYCGPPEFHLTCVDDSPELTIGRLSYRILKLDPAHQNMTVARSDLWNSACTDKLANSSLESEFFSYDEDDDMDLTIFYGCNSTYINPKPQNWFLCDLNFPFKDAYYLIGPMPLDPIVSEFKCSVGITVQIPKTTAAVLVGNRSLFKEAIMTGFNVNYTNPYKKQCAECLNVNGLCGFDSDKNRPVCICGKRVCDPAESSMIIIVGTLGSVAFCSLVVVVAGCFFRKRLRTVKERYHSKRQKKKVGNDMKKTVESLQFRLGTIETATNKFSDDNKLGEGGFGAVFKGTLGNGHEIAVKRLSKSSTQGVQEFQNEVVLVAKLQHRNLVRLLGFCLEGEETLLVYEYVSNKSLDKFLFEPKKREQLDWSRRCMIIGGIARGILYLHEDSRLRVIHRDLKASNILLDDKMNPKISDFGMAKMFGIDGQTQGNTERVVGTLGYMAPEYAIEGIYSVKSDVFSFGILLLEITTGRKNFLGFDCRFPTLLAHAWQSWNEGKGLDLIDPILLKDSCRPDQVLRYIHIGLLCVQEDANIRPTMSSVVLMLKTETISLSKPERPAFFTGRSANIQDQIAANSCTINGLTISDDLPR